MSRPGFKVMHIQDVDFRSSCATFVEGLQIIRDWSLAHPDHTPILITMNTNDEKRTRTRAASTSCRSTRPPTTRSTRRSSRCSRPDQLITPDDVRGRYPHACATPC